MEGNQKSVISRVPSSSPLAYLRILDQLRAREVGWWVQEADPLSTVAATFTVAPWDI